MASKDRERELARAKAARQVEHRRTRAERRRQRQIRLTAAGAVAAVLAGTVFLSLRGGEDEATLADPLTGATPSAPAEPTASADPAAAGTCSYPDSPAPAAKDVGTPPAEPTVTGTVGVTLTLVNGTVGLELDADAAPCTVNSFVHLATNGYYDATPCPRLVVADSFGVLQCGDPTGTGTGGPGYSYADENLSGATYPAGTVAMANSGPDSNGSQFFLVYKDTQLDAAYTPFGRITSGLDVLETIAAGGDDGSNPAGGGVPNIAVLIESATVAG